MSMQPKQDDGITLLSQGITVQHAGPLPTAAEFAGYEKTCKGAAKIILNNFTQQAEHRRKCEQKQTEAAIESRREELRLAEKEINNQNELDKLSLHYGCFVMLVLIGGSFVFAWRGNNAMAIALLAAPLFKFVVDLFKPRSAR